MATVDINRLGLLASDIETLKADVQAEYRAALGANLMLDDQSEQGRLIDTEVSARAGTYKLMISVLNQFNPDYSEGQFIRMISALHGLYGSAATKSSVPVTFFGTPGTKVPANFQLISAAGDIFLLTTTLTISASGNVAGIVQATTTGTKNIEANSLKIDDVLDGLTSITNAANSNTNGSDEPTDAELKNARRLRLFNMSRGHEEAIISDVLGVPEARACVVRVNNSTASADIDGVTIPAHCTWIAVTGGADADIAAAILNGAQRGSPLIYSAGKGTEVSVDVKESYSGQNYTVKFTRPTIIQCNIKVTVKSGNADDEGLPAAIQDALIGYRDGKVSGFDPIGPGSSLSPFELSSSISAQMSGVFVKRIEIQKEGGNWQTDSIAFQIWEQANYEIGSVSVIVEN